jgi:phosphatidylinositol glycan class M
MLDPTPSSRGWLCYVSDLHLLLLFALVLRIIFIYLGCFLDRNSISYTDVDYHVFTDAAEFIVQGMESLINICHILLISHLIVGKSPYERFGYRYPPVIGLLLVPGVYYNIPILGKLLFSLFDVLNVYMIYQIINSTKIIGDDNNNYKKNISVLLALSWAINPLAINICTRGNADSITNFIALTLLYLIQVKRNNFLSGILYGFLIYFRIYPIIYSLPIVLFIRGVDHTSAIRDIFSFHNAYKLMHFFHSALAMMLICTSLSYSVYGDQYLSDALYYHAQRYY